MNEIKILLVEDAKDQQEIFEDIVNVFNRESDLNVKYEIAEDTREASEKIDNSYHGAIIDLSLRDNEEGGNEIVHQLGDSFTRIPIIFVTAFANKVIDHPSVIRTRRREDNTKTYKSDLLLFQKIHDTGLTRIMGGTGLIEQQLSEVFLKNLLPQIDTWISYAEIYARTDPERTEKALLRYTLNHLLQLLEDDREDYFPEEVYLYPPVLDEVTTKSKLTTGSMVKANNRWFVVLSPACDLIRRGENGVRNTDRILLGKIERIEEALDGNTGKGKVTELCTNKHTYHHWLPETDFFEGGVLNFRKLVSLKEDDFEERFGKPIIQISPFFVKDIVSRFSSYYARQGQPDIDRTTINNFITRYTT